MNDPRPQSTQPAGCDLELERLLDQALAPEALPGGLPPDLAGRIVGRTADRLRRRRRVLARLGPRIAGALAAAVLAGASLGIVLVGASIAREVRDLRQIDHALSALRQYTQPFEEIDQEIVLLALQLEQPRGTGAWDSVLASLDEEIFEFEAQLGAAAGSQF